MYIKKIYIIIILLLILFNNYLFAKNHEFDNLIVFGDSLSDVGNYKIKTEGGILQPSKMVANDGKIYNEYLSKIFSGKEIYPSNQGGTNYANTNASVVLNPNTKYPYAISLFVMTDNYVEKNIHLNSKDLYIVWGGANDIANTVIFNAIKKIKRNTSIYFKNQKYSIFNAQKKLEIYDPLKYDDTSNSNLFITFISDGLIRYGAKYIIVPNLFDIAITPKFNLLPTIPIDNLPIILAPLAIPFLPLISNLAKNYKQLYNTNNIPSENTPGSGDRFIKQHLYNFFLNNYGLLGSFAYFFVDVATENTKQFNYYLVKRLEGINGNIVFIDIYNLYNEIIDNPTFYGINDILVHSCNTGVFINANDIQCKGDEYLKKNGGKTYLWSDLVHPSPFMHLIIAQYMISVFNAPVLVSSITYQLDSFNKNNNEYIFNQLISLNSNYNINKLIPFVSINGNVSKIGAPYDYDSKTTNTNSLNIGFSYALNTKLLLGAMFNVSFGKFSPYDNFRYRYNSQILSFFTKYQYDNHIWFNVNFNLGLIEVNNIKRTIILGKGLNIAQGNTNGRSIGLNLTGAYDFQYKDNITLTPHISLNFNNYKVNGFYEKENRSTSMRYGESSTTLKGIKIAIRATKKNNNDLNRFIELGLTQPINNNPIKIESGLKSTKISFIREIYNDKKPSINLAFGLNKELKNNIQINTNLNYKINTNKEQHLNYSIGLNMKF